MIALTVTSPAFAAGAPIPAIHAYHGEGENRSPAIAWSAPPPGTRELALVCDDPDAPRPEPWVHWVLYAIPAAAREIPADAGRRAETPAAPAGAKQGRNSFDELGWGGPIPPRGQTHHYHFHVWALDAPVGLAPGATKEELLRAIRGHVLAEGDLVGTYRRK